MFGGIFGSEYLPDCYFLVDVRPLVQELFFPKLLGVWLRYVSTYARYIVSFRHSVEISHFTQLHT